MTGWRTAEQAHQLPSPGTELQRVYPNYHCLQPGPSAGSSQGPHTWLESTSHHALSLLFSILRTQLSASLRGSLGRPEAPIGPVLAWGRTNGKIFFPRLNPKWAAAAGLRSVGPSRFHFKCYLSWTVLANEPPRAPFSSSPHHLYQIFYPHMLWPKPGPTGVHINQIVAYWPLWWCSQTAFSGLTLGC